jgi:hypothetical protein
VLAGADGEVDVVENDAIAARDVYVAQFEEVRVCGFVLRHELINF